MEGLLFRGRSKEALHYSLRLASLLAAAEFNKPLADVSLALDSSAGADLHEWAKRLAAGLGIDRAELYRSLVYLWIRHS